MSVPMTRLELIEKYNDAYKIILHTYIALGELFEIADSFENKKGERLVNTNQFSKLKKLYNRELSKEPEKL